MGPPPPPFPPRSPQKASPAFPPHPHKKMADEYAAPIDGDNKRKERDQAAPEAAEGDISLSCRDCNEGFLHTVADQVRSRALPAGARCAGVSVAAGVGGAPIVGGRRCGTFLGPAPPLPRPRTAVWAPPRAPRASPARPRCTASRPLPPPTPSRARRGLTRPPFLEPTPQLKAPPPPPPPHTHALAGVLQEQGLRQHAR